MKSVLFLAFILLPVMVFARMTSSNYVIESDSFNMGGSQSTSTDYILNDAFGEFVAQISTSSNYKEDLFVSSFLFRYFNITAPTRASLTGKTVSSLIQTSTSTISGVEVIDDGTVGWSLTINITHFTHLAFTSLLSGSNNAVDFTGDYDGLDGVLNPNGTFIVEITTGGAVGTAVFKWTDPAGNILTGSTTASTVSLSNGINVNFGAASYVAGDQWSAAVDLFPYTGLTITPDSVTVVSGDSGVSAGSQELLTGTGAVSDSKTLMMGAANDSTGTYSQNEAVELNIHANSLQGDFSAVATLTII